jgi:hypothetical protein
MNDDKKELTAETLTIRASLLDELITDRSKSIDNMIENVKKLDTYAAGTKEGSEKIRKLAENQKSEFAKYAEKENVDKNIVNIVEIILNNILEYTRNVSKEAENFYFAKQGELIFAKQELEKLQILKMNHNNLINDEKSKKDQIAETSLDNVAEGKEQEKPKRIRPDKDPSTRVGKAAIDLAERKRKYKKTN